MEMRKKEKEISGKIILYNRMVFLFSKRKNRTTRNLVGVRIYLFRVQI